MSDPISSKLDCLKLSIGDRIKEAVLKHITSVKNELTEAMRVLEKRLEVLKVKSAPHLASKFVVYETARGCQR